MKSNRQKLKEAIVKYSNIKIESWGYPGYYKHPKTGKRVTLTEANWYKQDQLEKLLDKFCVNETDRELPYK